MKNIVKVDLNGEKLYFTPAAYKEFRLSLSTGDFHCHKATRIKRAPKKDLVVDLNSYLLDALMPELARQTGLQHDGDERLFPESIMTHSLELSEPEYNAMEKDINSFQIKGAGFVVYAWNDCSGYNYWNVEQCENNYIQITVAVTDVRKADASKIRDAVSKAQDHFMHYDFSNGSGTY